MYGFWLPNDPRGSWSEYVRNWELSCHGKAAVSIDRKDLSDLSEEETAKRNAATDLLQFPQVKLTGHQALAIGNGFGKQVQKSKYTIWACAILPAAYPFGGSSALVQSGANRELAQRCGYEGNRCRQPSSTLQVQRFQRQDSQHVGIKAMDRLSGQ